MTGAKPQRRRREARFSSLGTVLVIVLVLSGPRARAQSQEAATGVASPPIVAAREASGTSWLPDSTPMSGVAFALGGWGVMVHGRAFAQFLLETGSPHYRSHGPGSINWLMVTAHRPVGSGRFGVRTMFSAEPWTIPRCGYPDLLATGEICNGDTIHDRQHPHDLVMELAAEFDRPLTGATRWQFYGGLAGEPALGPPAFLHRASAAVNPIAPITHHWFDSTHISFGVVTGALYGPRWKVEGSIFNGREPDEYRTDFDLGPLDSVSGRLSANPTPNLAFQVSGGHLREAEAGVGSFPRQDVNRVTASAILHRPIRTEGLWATTLAGGVKWGPTNVGTAVIEQSSPALLLETSIATSRRHTWYGRLEFVGKPAHDLHADEFSPEVFTVGKLQLGYARRFPPAHGIQSGVGAHINASLLPPELAPRYEGRVAPGFGVFVSIESAGDAGGHAHHMAHGAASP